MNAPWKLCSLGMSALAVVEGHAQFVAFNDYAPGPGTHTNATIYGTAGAPAGGLLKNITNGLTVGATVTITNAGTTVSGSQVPPAYGSPASIVFDGYVDFQGTPNPSIEVVGTATWAYVFTGLDPSSEYNFQGTAVRGNTAYTNRWTLFELDGAMHLQNRSTPGALTTSQVPGIATNQVAVNTGINFEGDLAWWEHIRPGSNGSFTVLSRQYLGTVPGGTSAGVKGYGMTGFRLEKNGVYSGRTNLPPRLPNLTPNSINGLKTVFVLMLENHSWTGTDGILGNTNCPYINNTLLPLAATATDYNSYPGIHPSEPNYLWLVSGTNFGVFNDNPPSLNHQSSTNTLFTLLDRAGISWKTYQENISGANVPDVDSYPYAVRHNPFVFFDAVRTNVAYCTNHIRPYSEFARDLTNHTVPRFNFLVPCVTNDMHDPPASTTALAVSDAWLSREVPKILASPAYAAGGVLFIAWDEGFNDADGPMGMLALSSRIKRPGYTNHIHYTHGSLLRTVQDVFGAYPYLGDALFANNLSDLFKTIFLTSVQWQASTCTLTFTNVLPGRINEVLVSTNVRASSWVAVATNVAASNSFIFQDLQATPPNPRFYRVRELP